MATRNFAINTEPHEAVIGGVTLLFEPEVIGAEFAEAYEQLRAVQQKVKGAQAGKASSTKHAKADSVDALVLGELSDAMREFVGTFLVAESREVFASLRLPDRILVQLMEWAAELYGGGSGDAEGNPVAAGGTSSD